MRAGEPLALGWHQGEPRGSAAKDGMTPLLRAGASVITASVSGCERRSGGNRQQSGGKGTDAQAEHAQAGRA